MKSAIFCAASDCYQVSNVIYAGSVNEIPESIRKNESTHSFKVITSQGPAYCYYKSQDSAKKARSALGAMMQTLKPSLFRSNGDTIDLTRVVSFGTVKKLKSSDDGFTHAFLVAVDGASGKDGQVWLTYKSEDGARNARKAFFGLIQAANGLSTSESEEQEENTTVECSTAGV